MNHGDPNTVFGSLLIILFILALSVVGLRILFVVLRKVVRLLAQITTLVPRRDLNHHGWVGAADQHDWHRWFAWRPVQLEPYDSNSDWVGRHWVWLKRVEWRVEPGGWQPRAYRRICK
jgi:hypothetical protein